MTSFIKLFAFLLLLALSLRLLPHAQVAVIAEVALLIVYVRAAYREVTNAADARLRAHFDMAPEKDVARRLMQEAGYAV